MNIRLDCIKRTEDAKWEVTILVDDSLLIDINGKVIEGQIYDSKRCSGFDVDLHEVLRAKQEFIDTYLNREGEC